MMEGQNRNADAVPQSFFLDMPEEIADRVPCWGSQSFQGQRLHVLQVGLGTFDTFLKNVCEGKETFPLLTWLLEAVSDPSKSLRGVGVEPMPEHVGSLKPFLQHMPNTTLVQAAMSRCEQSVDVYGLPNDAYNECLDKVCVSQRENFAEEAEFIRNMSCVGQEHPNLWWSSSGIKDRYGVDIKVTPTKAVAITYGKLASLLHFTGTEVLVIDTEGYDCQILESGIAHCQKASNSCAWPDVISFETLGHCDKIEGPSTEENDRIFSKAWLPYCANRERHDTCPRSRPRVETALGELD